MAASMGFDPETGAQPHDQSLIELSPFARLPRLDLGIDWGAPAREFRSSLESLLEGPRAPAAEDVEASDVLRVKWIEGPLPVRALGMSGAWHVALVWLLVLPIWGFLPRNTPTLAPVQIEVSWYGEPKDLPPISLPAAIAKPSRPARQNQPAHPEDPKGADLVHPRQTVLSIPVRVTHPRQTLVRPDVPNTPPKIVPQLPNIVQWNSPELAKPKFELSAAHSAPRLQQRNVRNVAAPELQNEKTPGPIDIAAKPTVIARPQIPLSAMSQPTTRQRQATAEAAAPDVNATESKDSAMRNVIALSATPGPPVPMASVPEGNLAARISMSPEGNKPGAPSSSSQGRGGTSSVAGGSGQAVGSSGSGSLPAAVAISGAPSHTGGGGIAAGGGRLAGPNLTPKESYQPTGNARHTPVDSSKLAAGLPPEKILSGSEVYTMHVNLPNVTSASGSWILNFAELEEGEQTASRPKARLADPVPVHVTDPKYPPDLIKGHVHGEVVLYAIIRRNGSVDSIQIVRDLDPELDRNAIDALEKWVFEPATRAGVPVDVEAVIHVPFSYTDPRIYPTTAP